MSTVFTQAASPLKLNLHAPKPASRFDDLSFDPMDASPLPARGLAAAGCVQAMPPRRSTSSARAPLVCASHRRSHTSPPRPRSAQARHKSDPHRPPKARRPQRRGRLHRLQARRPLRWPSGTASSCATTRTSSSPRDQTCSSTRAHLAPRAASPARPPLSNSSLRQQKLGLTASMCHSVLAQALSESMIQHSPGPHSPAPRP